MTLKRAFMMPKMDHECAFLREMRPCPHHAKSGTDMSTVDRGLCGTLAVGLAITFALLKFWYRAQTLCQ